MVNGSLAKAVLALAIIGFSAFGVLATTGLLNQQAPPGQNNIKVVVTSKYANGTSQGPAVDLRTYADPECSRELTSLDWGQLDANSTNTYTIYLKNMSEIPVTIRYAKANWEPANAKDYFTLIWNEPKSPLTAGGVTKQTFWLYVSPKIQSIGNFNVDIVIIASPA